MSSKIQDISKTWPQCDPGISYYGELINFHFCYGYNEVLLLLLLLAKLFPWFDDGVDEDVRSSAVTSSDHYVKTTYTANEKKKTFRRTKFWNKTMDVYV